MLSAIANLKAGKGRRSSSVWKRKSIIHLDVPAGMMRGNRGLKKILDNRERLSFDTAKLQKVEQDILLKALQTHASLRASAETDYIFDRVCDFPLFANFSIPDIAGVIEGSSLRKYEPHTVLFAESAPAVHGKFFIMLSGKVGTTSHASTGLWKAVKTKAVYNAADNALDMSVTNHDMVFIAGDAFGEECFLQDCLGLYERTAITKTECVMMEVTTENALKILESKLTLRVQCRPHFLYPLINPEQLLDKKQVKIELFSHTRDWPVMKKLTKDAGLKLLTMMDVVEVMAHKTVFLQGDKNDYVYIVLKGHVDVFLSNSLKERLTQISIRNVYPEGPITMEEKNIYGKHIATMKCGQIFGDFYDETSNNSRSASVVCRDEDCTLLRVSKDAYIDNFIIAASMSYSSENWKPIMLRSSTERSENDLQLLMHMATSVPLFQRFPRIEKKNILREMGHQELKIRRFGETADAILPNYEVLIEEGPILDQDPAMFWVLQGNLQVRSLKNKTKSIPCSPFAIMDQKRLEEALDARFGTLDFIAREGRLVGESILHTDALSMNRVASVIAGAIRMNSDVRNVILRKAPIDRTESDIQLLSEYCSQSQVLQHLPKRVSDTLLSEAFGMQLAPNEVLCTQNSKSHFFAILLDGSLSSHAFTGVDPALLVNEEELFDGKPGRRRILSSPTPSISDVRITRDFGPCVCRHFAGTAFGTHLLMNPTIGDNEATLKTLRSSTLIALEPSFVAIFQISQVDFNLSPEVLEVFRPELVVNALRVEPILRNHETIAPILTMLQKNFETTPRSKLAKIAKSMTIVNHKRNDVVFYQGDLAVKVYAVVSGKYAAFVPRAKLTNTEARDLVKSAKEDWQSNIEIKNVMNFSGCSIFGETAMFAQLARDAIRNASVVALEDSIVVEISREEYLVRNIIFHVLQHSLIHIFHDAVAGSRSFIIMNSVVRLRSMYPELRIGSLNDLFNIVNTGVFVQSTLQEFPLYDFEDCATNVYILLAGCTRFHKKGSSYSVSDKDCAEIAKQHQYAWHKATATGPFSWMGHPECDLCRQLQGGKVRERIDAGLMDNKDIPVCRTCRIKMNSEAWMAPSDGGVKHYAPDRHPFLDLQAFALFGLDYMKRSNVHKYKASGFGRDTRILKVKRAELEAFVGEQAWDELKLRLNADLEFAELGRLEKQHHVVQLAADEHVGSADVLQPIWILSPSVEGLFQSLARTGTLGPTMHADQWLFFCRSNGFLPKLGISEKECMNTFEIANHMEGVADGNVNELNLIEFCYCMILLAIRVGFLIEEEGQLLSPLFCSLKISDAVVALLDVMTNGKVKRGQRFGVSKASQDLYRQTLGKAQPTSANLIMPGIPKSEVVAIVAKWDQKQNPVRASPPVTPTKKSLKTPDRTKASMSPTRMRTPSKSFSPSASNLGKFDVMPQEPAPFGISGYKLHGNVEIGHLEAAMLKNEKAQHDQKESEDRATLPETPAALGRSQSMPSPDVSNPVDLPKLNRSSSNGEPGAAIKAALGSSLFTTFRRTSLSTVLEKVKTAVDEQDVSNEAKLKFKENIQLVVEDKIKMAAQEQTTFEISHDFSDATQSSGSGAHSKVGASKSNETAQSINFQDQSRDSVFYEESAEMKEAWDRVADAESRAKTPTKSIQTLWNFEPIPAPLVRPHSSLKKNADAAKRPSSAHSFNFSWEDVEFNDRTPNQSGTPRSMDKSGKMYHENSQVVNAIRNENTTREQISMGPGGFWRTGLHSASAAVIQRKMSSFVANLAEVREQRFTCDVCFSYRSKDAHGRCKKCGA